MTGLDEAFKRCLDVYPHDYGPFKAGYHHGYDDALDTAEQILREVRAAILAMQRGDLESWHTDDEDDMLDRINTLLGE